MKRLTNKSLVQSMVFFCWILSTEIPAQNTYALVIGLSQYKEITPLQFADRDAVAFAEFLKTQRVPETNIKLILNENATRLNVLDGMYNLTSQLKPNDRFYFYFGGHSDLEAQISSENSLLLLYNSFKKNYFQGSEFIQLFELKEWLGDLAKKQIEVVFIADACHSGGLIGGKEGISKTQTALNENWAGITKILSCKSDEFSLEGKQWGGGRGLFSYHLVNGLIGRADANADKKVSLSELDNYLKTNVLKQANPNVQTPVVIGNNKQILSITNTEGLDKIAELEQKNFALMTEVNTRGDDKKSLDELAKLDTTIVETYKKFAKALKDKRVNIHDDSLDCALIHYRKLETYKLPDNLMQMIKRNMAVGLMELELEVLHDVREKGVEAIAINPKIIQAKRNLEEVVNIFGSNHYTYNSLQARMMVLEANFPQENFFNKTNDEGRKLLNEEKTKHRQLLLNSLIFEPNMISTYAFLSFNYRSDNRDSSVYYQEKVTKLLPNQGLAFWNLAFNYFFLDYEDSVKRPASLQKSIYYNEKTIDVDSTMERAYEDLSDLYSEKVRLYNNIPDSIRYYNLKSIKVLEKLLDIIKLSDDDIKKIGYEDLNVNRIFNKRDANKTEFAHIHRVYASLMELYNAIGDKAKADEYATKINKMEKLRNSPKVFLGKGMSSMSAVEYSKTPEIELNKAIDNFLIALKMTEDSLKITSPSNKPFIILFYKEILISLGIAYRALNKYEEAEKYYFAAINYPVLSSPADGKMKMIGSFGMDYQDRLFCLPQTMEKIPTRDEYWYRMDVYTEMFFLKIDQNKQDEAYKWWEKALQQSVKENGNDISGQPFTEEVLSVYKKVNKEEFLKLRYKYFPKAVKTKFEK